MNAQPILFRQLINNRLKFRWFLFRKLPSAFFSGLRVQFLGEARAVVSIPFKWFTQNPFRSTYFACLSMAAEMSTGLLAMMQVYKSRPVVSMLVVNIESTFFKKATGLTRFICEDGQLIGNAIARAIATGEGQPVKVKSTGVNSSGDLIAEFFITWSFKIKNKI